MMIFSHIMYIYNQELYNQLPCQRKLSKDDQEHAKHLLSLKANKKMVKDEMSAKSGKVIILKDLSNLMRRNDKDTRNDLTAAVKLLTEKHGNLSLCT